MLVIHFSLHSLKFQTQKEHNTSSLQTSKMGTRRGEEVERREERVSTLQVKHVSTLK